MSKHIGLSAIAFCLLAGTLAAQGAKTFVGGPVDNRVLLRSVDDACFICGRTPADFDSALSVLLDGLRARLAMTQLQASASSEQSSKLALDIQNGVADKNKGVLDLPLGTIRKDVASFAKMVPQLQTVLDYASRESISSDMSLSQVLDAMRSGGKAASASAEEINDERMDVAVFADIGTLSVAESFVRIDVGISDLLQVNANLVDSSVKLDYDKWMRANQAAMQEIRTAYGADPTVGRAKLLMLLDKANSLTPTVLQQAVRTGVIYQLMGSPGGTIRIKLCPICRELFEGLNDRFRMRYTNKQ